MIREILWLLLIGLVVGVLGRLLHPGRDPIGIGLTILIGIGASVIVGLLVPGHGLFSFILAVIVAALLVAAVSGGWRRRRRWLTF
jgi:uncharacterized membrane protein YeaQ/YmgE (transglycosylase-associated protein family)